MGNRRSNQEWLDHLRGLAGVDEQQRAHRDLGNYLYRVGYNYLLKRQSDVPALYDLNPIELSEWVQDSIQDVLEKLSRDNFALLGKFRDEGRFLGWVALILRNDMAGQLRLSRYSTRTLSLDAAIYVADAERSQSELLIIREVEAALQDCIDRLPDHMQYVLVECVARQRRSKEVAVEVDRTENAVNLLVMRAKRRVFKCLQKKGVDPDVLNLFL